MSYRQDKMDGTENGILAPINVVGEIDETVTLTNITFSGGNAITRAVIFYREE